MDNSGATFYLLNYAASDSYYPSANTEIRNYKDSDPRVRFIDIAAEVLKDCPVSKHCPDLFFPDFHPAKKGYEKVATLIANTFEKDLTISK